MPMFEQAFAVVIGHEGGYVDNPHDPGGETKFGISRRSYPKLDIRNLTLDQARTIYRADYWAKAYCDQMPPALALLQFDSAVNNGIGQAARFLQLALGVTADGIIGPATLAALKKAVGVGTPATVDALCAEVLARRIVFHASLSAWQTFGLGWSRRLAMLPFQAVEMA
jgi:lysozyme family protein